MTCAGPWPALSLVLDLPLPAATRTDRLLASGLGLSRARVQDLESSGRLAIEGRRLRRLRRPITDQLSVRIDLQSLDDGETLGIAASGVAEPVPSTKDRL